MTIPRKRRQQPVPHEPAHTRVWRSLWRRCSCGLPAPCVDRLVPAPRLPFPPPARAVDPPEQPGWFSTKTENPERQTFSASSPFITGTADARRWPDSSFVPTRRSNHTYPGGLTRGSAPWPTGNPSIRPAIPPGSVLEDTPDPEWSPFSGAGHPQRSSWPTGAGESAKAQRTGTAGGIPSVSARQGTEHRTAADRIPRQARAANAERGPTTGRIPRQPGPGGRQSPEHAINPNGAPPQVSARTAWNMANTTTATWRADTNYPESAAQRAAANSSRTAQTIEDPNSTARRASTDPRHPQAATDPPRPRAGTNPPRPRAGTSPPPSRTSTNSPPSRAGTDSPLSRAGTSPPPARASTNPPRPRARTDPPRSRASTDPPPSQAGTDPPSSRIGVGSPPSWAHPGRDGKRTADWPSTREGATCPTTAPPADEQARSSGADDPSGCPNPQREPHSGQQVRAPAWAAPTVLLSQVGRAGDLTPAQAYRAGRGRSW